MRCLSETLPKSAGIRVNTLCPWFAETSTTAVFDKQWKRAKLPVNTTADVANIVVDVACEREFNGNAFYVEGKKCSMPERG
jgi:NAD(P)-dependent dehydrogenase (short-subunit alcohol dehydrogenase family)